jgi:hypothetical protein
MKRRNVLSLALAAVGLSGMTAPAAAALPPVQVYKSRYCECCGAWVRHLSGAGFPVKVTLVEDTTAARGRLGMPDKFGSCHTATVAGYVLEGHVPASDVKRMLALKPNAIGLAVPGMVPGSPGMEVESGRVDAYTVFLIEKSGRESVFARYPKA